MTSTVFDGKLGLRSAESSQELAESVAKLERKTHTMPMEPSILVYGRDPRLLETRRWVLEKAGYRVFIAQTLTGAEDIATTEPISLLVLCHSLTVVDCQNALAAFDKVKPDMKRLLITANTPLCAHGPQDRVLSAFDGPTGLLAAVSEMAPQLYKHP